MKVLEEKIFSCDKVKIMLREDTFFKDFAKSFCQKNKEELKETKEKIAFCENYLIIMKENRELLIGKTRK